jgi:outer membrane lipoprotein-sorting protein
VPIAVVAVVGAALGTAPVVAAVQGDPVLPERTAAQLLSEAVRAGQAGKMPPMSGTVVETASFGIPGLPQAADQSSSPLSLLSGSHEVKVWYGDAGRLRVALPGRMSETNLIVNGDETWLYESSGNRATRIKVPAEAAAERTPLPVPATPQDVAERVLSAAAADTDISVTSTEQVAGRDAYQLVLAPKEPDSLVKEIRLALDGETYVPLRVQVYAKDAIEPAFEVGYRQVTFTPPAEENFTFTPPAGAKVEERTLDAADLGATGRQDGHRDGQELAGRLKMVGDSWATIAVLPFDRADLAAPAADGRPATDLAGTVVKSAKQVSGSWGSGRLLETKLVSVLLTDDGKLLAGAVRPEALFEAAGRE